MGQFLINIHLSYIERHQVNFPPSKVADEQLIFQYVQLYLGLSLSSTFEYILIKRWGEVKAFCFTFSQVSGSKFFYLKNEAVLLEMALLNWTLSEVMKKGFTPLTTPEIVRSSIVEKCGFQPRGDNTQVPTILMCLLLLISQNFFLSVANLISILLDRFIL